MEPGASPPHSCPESLNAETLQMNQEGGVKRLDGGVKRLDSGVKRLDGGVKRLDVLPWKLCGVTHLCSISYSYILLRSWGGTGNKGDRAGKAPHRSSCPCRSEQPTG